MSAAVQPDAQSAPEPTSMDLFWVMTVQTADGRVNTRTAVITAPVGFKRSQAFSYVFEQFKKDYGSPLTVLFFDLAENEI
jgi:hypothetical protein